MTSNTKVISKAELLASRPGWAKAAIIAELEIDKSDSMTDYFATSTEKRVFLAWSSHTRDLFSEMRKAAATFGPTAHLGPGKDIYKVYVATSVDVINNGSAYWKGTPSPWHRDMYGDAADFHYGVTLDSLDAANAFIAKAGPPHDISVDGKVATFEWKIDKKSVEIRGKYSMGPGYLLKGSGVYSSGWTVSKTYLDFAGDMVTVLDVPAKSAPVAVPAPSNVPVTVTLNAAKNGVEIRFAAKPSKAVLDSLKANGWRWSKFGGLWYHRDTPAARNFADSVYADAVAAA